MQKNGTKIALTPIGAIFNFIVPSLTILPLKSKTLKNTI